MSYANQYCLWGLVHLKVIYRETSPRDMSRLTNRSAREICTICNTANKGYVKVIDTCRKTVLVLSQLTCINTYIKYVTEKSHKKIVNYVKSTLVSIMGAEQFALLSLNDS
jgi:hypothetical protein